MNRSFPTHRTMVAPLVAAALTASLALHAAPGAHGPGGEHLDQQAAPGAPASAAPRVEMRSDLFEAVGQLHEGEFSLLVDRYETNEPVLGAHVEIESGEAKAVAKFHADHGDYSVDDPAFLRAIAAPGNHPIVITVIAGQQTDLLEGTLRVAAAAHVDDHGHGLLARMNPWLLGSGGGALLVLSGIALMRRTRTARAGEPA